MERQELYWKFIEWRMRLLDELPQADVYYLCSLMGDLTWTRDMIRYEIDARRDAAGEEEEEAE